MQGVQITSSSKLTTRGPRSPMAEADERELCSSADELARKVLSTNSSPWNPRWLCMNCV